MDHLIEATMRRWMIPGLSLAVVRDGQLLCARGFGLADIASAKPATEQTVYPLASVTKIFTATAVMLLVEDGALELDRAVAEVLPGLPSSWAGITIGHLLAHTSGIKDCYADAGFWYHDAATPWDRIRAVARLRLAFPPGAGWAYSNTGYLLLGEVIATVSGQPYDQLLAARVFRPLGMARTRVNDPRGAGENWATGYRRRFRWWRLRSELAAVDPPHPLIAGSADGGLVGTALDMATWDIGLGGGGILREESLHEMWTPRRLPTAREPGYGLGWAVDEFEGQRVVWHSGGDPGFATCYSRFVDNRVSVVVLANRGGNLFLGIHEAVFNLTCAVMREYSTRASAEPLHGL
jgi:CubicO group peptidase (beta-lactamase class C family)